MAQLLIHPELVSDETAAQLTQLCPFGAIHYDGKILDIDAGCKMCRMCVRSGPPGVITFEGDQATPVCDKDAWRGVAVFAELGGNGRVHNVTLELIGKARELAAVTGHPVYVLLMGSGAGAAARDLLRYGVDKVFLYDHPAFSSFLIEAYANAFSDFIRRVRPSAILVGATNLGRTLAPRVAARFQTGVTADCTVLQMRENTDLVQIRPAFGGNVMAQIITTRSRPQFCTVRYKIFSAPDPVDRPSGTVEVMEVTDDMVRTRARVLEAFPKAAQLDLSEAKVVVAVGRGVKKESDLEPIRELAGLLGAQLACTRPLVEKGWFDSKRQIGLSGRTVNADLIITVGVSGSVQFAAGMKGSACIVSINSDPAAPIFDIAHYGICGDWYTVLPALLNDLKGGR